MNLSETLHKYRGVVATTAAAEVVATGMVAASALEGHPIPAMSVLGLYSFMTVYVGIPAGIVAQGVLRIMDFLKGQKPQFPQSAEFPQTSRTK